MKVLRLLDWKMVHKLYEICGCSCEQLLNIGISKQPSVSTTNSASLERDKTTWWPESDVVFSWSTCLPALRPKDQKSLTKSLKKQVDISKECIPGSRGPVFTTSVRNKKYKDKNQAASQQATYVADDFKDPQTRCFFSVWTVERSWTSWHPWPGSIVCRTPNWWSHGLASDDLYVKGSDLLGLRGSCFLDGYSKLNGLFEVDVWADLRACFFGFCNETHMFEIAGRTGSSALKCQHPWKSRKSNSVFLGTQQLLVGSAHFQRELLQIKDKTNKNAMPSGGNDELGWVRITWPRRHSSNGS